MLWSEEQIRANLRNQNGKRVFYLGRGDQLTPSARDYLSRQRIQILPGEAARQDQFRLLNGAVLTEKPEHITHLNQEYLVEKTHPRILFRGAMDTLEAELLLAMAEAPGARKQLEEVLTLARNVIRWEVLGEAAKAETLCGLTEEEIRRQSHFPQDYEGQPHFMPAVQDGKALLQLNRTRCAARQAELAGVRAFVDGDGKVCREDLLRILNRMSSMLYLLMIRMKAGKL